MRSIVASPPPRAGGRLKPRFDDEIRPFRSGRERGGSDACETAQGEGDKGAAAAGGLAKSRAR